MADINTAPSIMPDWRYENMSKGALRKVMCARKLTTRRIRDKDDMVTRLGKADMQSTVYDGIGKQELQAMVKDRAAQWCDCPGKCNEPVATLEMADRNRTFHRFLDLPPELRNRICEFSFADLAPLADALVRPKQPAVTRTCRQLRNESLALFYATQTFVLMTVDVRSGLAGLQYPDASWLRAIGSDNVSNIRSLVIASFDYTYLCVTEIKLGKDAFTVLAAKCSHAGYRNMKEYGGLKRCDEQYLERLPRGDIEASLEEACTKLGTTHDAAKRVRKIAEAAYLHL